MTKKGKLTLEDYQVTRKVVSRYLKEVHKHSKQRAWEEGQSLSGLWTWMSKVDVDEESQDKATCPTPQTTGNRSM